MYDSCDRRINYLRVSITDRCNLRCTYCMPERGIQLMPHDQILRLEEIAEIVKVAVNLGIDKVRLTGGEPLVRKGVVHLVEMLAGIVGIHDLAMTTNGILLPQFAKDLRAAGLHRINVSLDTLNPERFRTMTRGGEVSQVLAGIQSARDAGFRLIKLNCVVEHGPDEPDARAVADYAQKFGHPIRFIMRMETETGRFTKVHGGDGGDCKRCNRLRLSCSGLIRPCLFNNISFDTRTLGIEKALRDAVALKPVRGSTSGNRMHAVGG